MNAYDLMMLLIFINAGIFIVASIDVFGTDISEDSAILSWFDNVDILEDDIGVFSTITSVIAGGLLIGLAIAMWTGATRFGNIGSSSPQGWAILIFVATFVISCAAVHNILFGISKHVTGFAVFQGVFLLVEFLALLMAIVQFGGGGVKTHA